MKKLLVAVMMVSSSASFAGVVGTVSTNMRLLGSNDSIVVESLTDDQVKGVTCHVSYAKVGGLSGAIGIAEDPSRFSIACRQTGPIVLNSTKQTEVAAFDRNIFFKEMKVVRMYDKNNSTIVYLVYSKKLIDGSPFNSISTIPAMPWGTIQPVINN